MAGGSATINIIQCGYVHIVLETYGAVRLVSLYVFAKSITGWDCPMVATQKCFRSANETGVLVSSKCPKWQVFFS